MDVAPARSSLSVARRDVDAGTVTTVAVIAVSVLAAGLRFWRIGHQSFWFDESVTLGLLHHSLGGMLGLLPGSEGTPPVYYCVAWVWARIFGFSEAGLRSLSAVAGVGVVAALYGIGARLISRRAGLIAAALAACSPMLIWYSQEARAYSLLALFVTLSLLAFVHLLTPTASGRWLVGWAVAAGLALGTHYYAVLAVVPQALALLWLHRRDPRAWLAVAAVAAVGGALIPLAVSQKGNTVWIAELPLGQRLSQVPSQFVLGTGAPARAWLKLAGAVGVLVAITLLVLRADVAERRGTLIAGGLAAAGFVLALALVVVGIDYVITRNLIAVLIALIVFVAGGLGARRAGLLGVAGAGVLCVIGVVATIAVAVDWRYQRPDWRGVVDAVGANHASSVPRAILVENDNSLIPLADYVPGLFALVRFGAPVHELDVVAAVKGPSDPLCWWGAACHLPQAPLDTSIRIPGLVPYGPVLHVNQFAIERLRAKGTVRLTAAEVARALQGAPLRSYGLLIAPPAGALP